ncbi:hypothetical protein B296_00023916 [Ensete ventricosum]|uniref:Uncharacterized protein n=1 Tax=Ensete ventricosum TaxID=4639 RepID=A0A426X873_ENSVE|nr:hypothetical protein B296_00023916 [Ensete ventricosum]
MQCSRQAACGRRWRPPTCRLLAEVVAHGQAPCRGGQAMARATCKGDSREGSAYGHNAHKQAAYGLDGRVRQRPPARVIVGGAALHNGDGGNSLEEGRRSYIPIFQIRMEKMKEVKRPPSLVVSTRWISVVKLLQYDLATLAQREGGE